MKQLLMLIGFASVTGFCDKKTVMASVQKATINSTRSSAALLDYVTFFIHVASNDNVSGK